MKKFEILWELSKMWYRDLKWESAVEKKKNGINRLAVQKLPQNFNLEKNSYLRSAVDKVQ